MQHQPYNHAILLCLTFTKISPKKTGKTIRILARSLGLSDFYFLFFLVFNKRSLVDAFTRDDPTAFGYDKREEATKKSDIENQRKKKSS